MARSFRVYNAFIIALVLLAILGLSRCVERVPLRVDMNGQDSETPASSAPVEDQHLTTIDNKSFALKQLKGRTVVVHYWATWCPPCVRELPDLIAAAERNGGVAFVVISVDKNKDDIVRFLRQIGRTTSPRNLYHVHDPYGAVTIGGQRVTSFPETFILDKNLAISSHIDGAVDWRNFRF